MPSRITSTPGVPTLPPDRGEACAFAQRQHRDGRHEPDVERRGRRAPAQAREALSLLQRGLRDLDPTLIPDGWV